CSWNPSDGRTRLSGPSTRNRRLERPMISSLCDLCNGSGFEEVASSASERALRSDRTIVPVRLSKLECRRCGIVSDACVGRPWGPDYYRVEYRLAQADHQFYTAHGPVSRSALIADWIDHGLREAQATGGGPRRVLEVGAGAGFLLAEISARYPDAIVEGFELNDVAARAARTRGFHVTGGS